MRIPSGTTNRYIYFVAVDASDLTTRETGLTGWTVYGSKNGAVAAVFTTPTINETDSTNMPGVYELLLDEQTTLTAGNDTEELALHITDGSSLMAPVTRVVEIYRPETTEGNTLDVTSTGAAGIDWGNVENQGTSVDLSATATNLVDTCTTNTDMRGTDNALLAASAPANFGDLAITITTGLVSVGTNNDKTGYSISGTKTTLDALNDISTTQVNTEVDTALSDIGLQYLVNTALPTSWTTDITANSALDYMADDGTAAFDRTTDSLQALRDNQVAATDIVSGGAITTSGGAVSNVTTVATTTSVTNDVGVNEWNGVALGTTNPLPNAAAGAAGGLPTDSTGKTSFNDVSTAQVNAEVVDVMKTDTISEMAQQAPPTTPTFEEAVMYLYMALINKVDVTSTLKEFHNNAGTVIWKKTLSDDGTTYTEADGATGP